MLLAIDVGNTNITFAVFDKETLRSEWRISTSNSRTAEEYAAWLMQLMSLDGMAFKDIDAVIIATVVPQALFNLKTLSRRYFDSEPMVIGDEGVDLGIRILIDKPHEVGADRLVDAVGAHLAYGGPLIVIDFGTATTFDVVDGEGNYRGGVIAPGVNLSVEALHMAAAKLPRIAVERPEKVIGSDTLSSMQSGIFWGYVSLIEGLVARIRAEFAESNDGAEMSTVATGGLAPLFFGGTDAIEKVDADLTMRGLLEIYRRNTKL